MTLIEWIEPLMGTGNWMPALVEMAGGVNLLGEPDKHSGYTSWENIVGSDPDVIIVCPCGFDISRTESEMYWLTRRPEWRTMRAVRHGRV